jgi:hypothetical protein
MKLIENQRSSVIFVKLYMKNKLEAVQCMKTYDNVMNSYEKQGLGQI